jgi:hypothetical protein
VREREREREERETFFTYTGHKKTRNKNSKIEYYDHSYTLWHLSLSLFPPPPSQFKTQNSGEFKECPFDVCWDVS